MVFDIGLPASELRQVYKAYSRSYERRTTITVLDLDHNIVDRVGAHLIDGQVTIDWEGEDATRTCEMAFFDPGYELGFDVADSNQGVWFFDRMLQVRIEMFVPTLARWVEFPVFTGPVRGFKRNNAIATVKCVGKDIFARRSWPSYTIAKGTRKDVAIHRILSEAGETQFRFEASSAEVLPADRVISRAMQDSPFGYCRRLATEMGLFLFYNGLGQAVLRRKDPNVIDWEVLDGNGGLILTHPDVEADYDRIANAVRVESTQNAAIAAEVMVDTVSAIHPNKLLRGGKPQFFGYEVQSDAVKTVAEAKSVATATLADRQYAAYTVKFDALPLYAAEEVDRVRVRVNGDKTNSLITSMSIGLTPSAMSFGYTRMVAPVLAQIRRI